MFDLILSFFLQDGPILPPPPPNDDDGYVQNENPGIPDSPAFYAPIEIESTDWRKMDQRKSTAKIFIYISDQNDFETDFVRQTLDIPDNVLSKQIRSKFPGHLEKWLHLRRTLKYQLIVKPEIDGPPMVAYKYREYPKVLAYPYTAVPDHTIFLEHLHYLCNLSQIGTPDDIVSTEYFEFGFGFKNHKGVVEPHSIKLCVDDIKFDASPLLGYHPFYYAVLDKELIIYKGATVQEQFNLLDAGTGFLVKKK